jgi:hypothetical protein
MDPLKKTIANDLKIQGKRCGLTILRMVFVLIFVLELNLLLILMHNLRTGNVAHTTVFSLMVVFGGFLLLFLRKFIF